MNIWLCSTTDSVTPHVDQAAAEAQAAGVKGFAVAWLCCAVEPAMPAQTAVIVPVSENRGGVASVFGRKFLGPQIEEMGIA